MNEIEPVNQNKKDDSPRQEQKEGSEGLTLSKIGE